MIDWKKIPKIDAHIHLMPQDVIEANKEYHSSFIDFGGVREYLTLMEQHHIERAFIMPFNDPYMMSMDFTVESTHENLKSMTAVSPQKLSCFADVDLRKNISQTIEELRMILKNDNFLGIKLHPSNTGYPIDGGYYDEIFSFAEKENVLVEVHSYPREHLKDDVCSPSRIKRVLAKHPNVRLSVAHLGGFQWEELVGVNAYCNLSAILPDLAARHGVEETNKILRKIGVEKLIFATDYPDSRSLKPDEIYDKYFEILSQMDFIQAEAEQICMGNALRMLGREK